MTAANLSAASGQPAAPSMGELFTVFARIGILSVGGPAGQIALMHRLLVEERRWLDEARFHHALSYCMLLPGPEAMQLATYIGWLLRGTAGGLVAGLLFVLPGAALMVLLSALYMAWGTAPLVEGVLFGLKAAVVAVIVQALARLSRRALKGRFHLALAAGAFVALALFSLPFPLVILVSAIAGALWGRRSSVDAAAAEIIPSTNRPAGARHFLRTTGIWLAVWLVPLLALWLTLGRENVFVQGAGLFSVMAAVTFGGAYAVLAYVAQQAVEVYGWMRPDEMLTGLGLAESTPGPLILVLVFVGFLGGARVSGLEPMAGGLLGAVVALWFTFVPCFLWIFAGAPYVETVRGIRWLASALAGVTAAVVGVIASLGVWFAFRVFFGELSDVSIGPATLSLPVPASVDAGAIAIAALSGIALVRFNANVLIVLGSAALAGMLLTLV